jgi:hypothetical protein
MFRHILEDKIRNSATLTNSGAKAHIIILSNKISPFTAKEILTFEIRKEKRYFYFFTIFLDYLLQYLQNALIIFFMVIDFYIFPPHACTPFCVFHFTNNILIVWKFFCHPLYIVHTITTYASRLTLVFLYPRFSTHARFFTTFSSIIRKKSKYHLT